MSSFLFRGLVVLTAMLPGGSTPVLADTSHKLTIRWHGQSFFELETSKGTRIAIDPHAIEAYGRTDVTANLILITHFHNDHDQKEVIRNYARAKLIEGLKRGGKKLDWNPVDETFRDVHIQTVGVYHDDVEGMERGKNAVFVLEADGLRIVHLGDLGHLLTPKQIKAIGPVDVLMIPVGGVYTINGADAKQVVEQLKPSRYIIPMHYGTRVYDDLLPADEFLEDQKNVKKFPSNKLTIETDLKLPEPIIAILDWKN
jgi:L-ascorbate metabolism protein UlaG (beta-lactamase superfamily)